MLNQTDNVFTKAPELFSTGGLSPEENVRYLELTKSIPNGVSYFLYKGESYAIKKSTLAHGPLPKLPSDKRPIVSVHIDIAKVDQSLLANTSLLISEMSDSYRQFEEHSLFVLSLDQSQGSHTTSDPFVPSIASTAPYNLSLESMLVEALNSRIEVPSFIGQAQLAEL